jgi:hypothetical protein
VTIVETSNVYPVLTGVSDHLNNFLVGFREYDHCHVTVEQGGVSRTEAISLHRLPELPNAHR